MLESHECPLGGPGPGDTHLRALAQRVEIAGVCVFEGSAAWRAAASSFTLWGPWWRYWGSAKRRQVRHEPRASDGGRWRVGALHKVLTVQ